MKISTRQLKQDFYYKNKAIFRNLLENIKMNFNLFNPYKKIIYFIVFLILIIFSFKPYVQKHKKEIETYIQETEKYFVKLTHVLNEKFKNLRGEPKNNQNEQELEMDESNIKIIKTNNSEIKIVKDKNVIRIYINRKY